MIRSTRALQVLGRSKQADEIKRCANDPAHFIETYCHVSTMGGTAEKVTLYPVQRILISKYQDHPNLVLAHARSSRTTSLTSFYFLWLALFHWNKTYAICAQNFSVIRQIRETMLYAYDRLPSWLGHKVSIDYKQSLGFANGSVIRFGTSTHNFRGMNYDRIYFDAFSDLGEVEQHDLATTIFPSIQSGAGMIVAGQPTRSFSLFNDTYIQSAAQMMYAKPTLHHRAFHVHKIKIDMCPFVPQAARDAWLNLLGRDEFQRIFMCEFAA